MEQPRLLRLPREVRDLIYQHCVSEHDGYHYDFDTKKFRTADGGKIDLALMFTCKQLLQEVRSAVFRNNVVHFSTSANPSESERYLAGRFTLLQREILNAKMDAVRATRYPGMSNYRTPELENQINKSFPQFKGLLLDLDLPPDTREEHIRVPVNERIRNMNSGEAYSAFEEYLDTSIAAFSQHPSFIQELSECKGPHTDAAGRSDIWGLHFALRSTVTWYQSFYRSPHFLSSPKAWHIPSEQELAALVELLNFVRVIDWHWTHIKWRFSAAAIAISFLNSLAQEARCALRTVSLHEDFKSASAPESHGLGLVPFCTENPHLKIERRVNVWRCFVPKPTSREMTEIYTLHRLHLPLPRDRPYNLDRAETPSAQWMTEALALTTAGMPSGSFSLVFDAEPLPGLGEEFFEAVKLTAVWQSAWEQCNTERSVPLNWLSRKSLSLHVGTVFPQIVSDIVKGRSLISCTFPTGDLPDARPVIGEYRGLDDEHWEAGLSQELKDLHATNDWCPRSLAPSWLALQMEEFSAPTSSWWPWGGSSISKMCRDTAHYLTGGIFSSRA